MATDGRSQQVRPLLIGKTSIPPVPPGAVARPRLVDLLDTAATPLSVVVASAGWGKTTLLAQWAKHSATRSTVAWLTLDESDNDPLRFWTYVVTALQRAGSSAGSSAAGALNVASLDPIDLAVPQLLNDLAEAEEPQAVVLDDFHLITDSRITQAVEFLVTYLPATTRLLLGSRFDPPLPLALWRGRRMLTEIRAGQLRFRTDEAAELVGRTAELDLQPGQLHDLVEVTEGWAAGLQLSAMAVRSSPDPSRLVEAISGKHRHVIDFISSEVLGSLKDAHRDFLIRTSVLSALSAPLCDASLGIRCSQEFLEELVALEPFLQRIGTSGWFRCHPVLRDALRREAGGAYGDDQELVRTRASVWYLQAGEPESAIRLLIDGGKLPEAAGLLLEYENHFLEAGQIGIFLGLSQSLGPEIVESSPGLAVTMAWAAGVAGRPELVAELLDRAEKALTGNEPAPAGWRSLAGSAAANRGMFGYQAGLS
ncbi:MAG TPA: LuxR family transcriptional regulator, partial [Actinomycetota bacterium]|nr:LuxR family transcriptional regulator [Actinomycetota bacterium]